MRAERLCAARCTIGESPVWMAGESALYWVDIGQSRLHRLCDETHESFALPETVSAIAPAAAGGFVAAARRGFARLEFNAGEIRHAALAPLPAAGPDIRMNDGALDRQGRFWAGSMPSPPEPADPQGHLFRLDTRGMADVRGGLLTQNGLAFSPDGRTMYLSDSHPAVSRIWAFDYDTETGTPSNQRVFAERETIGGRPDGATVDCDGCYWIAASDGGRIVRLTPAGAVDAVIEVPTRNPTNICFGGPDLSTLFITSLTPAGPDQQAGNLFVLATPWQGIAETPFA